MELEEIRTMIVAMSDKEITEFFDGIAERGATRALKKVGLDDEFAAEDLRNIRHSWKAWLSLKKLAWKGFWIQIGRIIGVGLTISLLWMMFGSKGEKIYRLIGGG